MLLLLALSFSLFLSLFSVLSCFLPLLLSKGDEKGEDGFKSGRRGERGEKRVGRGNMALECNTRRTLLFLALNCSRAVREWDERVPFDSDYSGEDDASPFYFLR